MRITDINNKSLILRIELPVDENILKVQWTDTGIKAPFLDDKYDQVKIIDFKDTLYCFKANGFDIIDWYLYKSSNVTDWVDKGKIQDLKKRFNSFSVLASNEELFLFKNGWLYKNPDVLWKNNNIINEIWSSRNLLKWIKLDVIAPWYVSKGMKFSFFNDMIYYYEPTHNHHFNKIITGNNTQKTIEYKNYLWYSRDGYSWEKENISLLEKN